MVVILYSIDLHLFVIFGYTKPMLYYKCLIGSVVVSLHSDISFYQALQIGSGDTS